MRTRPRSILFITLLFAIFPLIFAFVQIAQAHFHFSQLNAWSWMDSITIICSLVIAASIWSVRPWGYYTCVSLIAIGVLQSLVAYCRAPDMSGYTYLMCMVATAAATAFLLQRHVAAPYFNPRQRWWETPTRYRAQFQVLASIQGKESPVELVDISSSGCFVHNIENIAHGELLYVRIAFLDMRLDLLAKVVRKCSAPIDGVGLMFIDLTKADRKDLLLLMEHLQNHRIKLPAENAPTAA